MTRVAIHLPEPTEWTTPTVKSNVNYGRWVLMVSRGGFTSCNKYPTLVGDVMCTWDRDYVGHLDLPLNSVNLKMLCTLKCS